METKNVVNEAVMGTANNVNGSYHEVGGSKKTTITEAVKYDTPSNIDNVNDLIKMGLSGNQLQPCEKNINPIIDSYIHPANIPRPLRMLNCWYLIQGDNLIDVYSGEQHSTSEPPTAQQFDMCVYGEMCHHTEALAFALTKENRIGVIRILNVVDLRKGTVDSAVNEVIKTFPDNSVSVYYAPNYGSIDIIFKYGEGTEIESMEFTDSHNLRIRICSAGDFWKTRAYLYSIKYCSLVECAGVEKAIGALGICKHSEEIQESNEDQLITECGSISETTVSDVTEDKAGVEEYDFSYLLTPGEPDAINVVKETEPPDSAESNVVTETSSVNGEIVTSEKSSDTVQIEETTLVQIDAVIDNVPIDTENSFSEIPDMDSQIDPNIPILTEADLIPKDDRTPEEILRECGFIDPDSVPEKVYTEVTSSSSIVSRLTDDLPTSHYQWINLEGMVHENIFVPDELKRKKIWICRCGKHCWSPNGRYMISPTAVNECVTYDEAMAAVEKYGYDGVSIMLMDSNDIWGVDIDHPIKDGKINPIAWSIIKKLNSWTELSTSGSGFHTYVLADKRDRLDWLKKKVDVCGTGITLELYPNKRHLVSTGRTLKGFEQLRRADKELEEIYNAYMAPSYKKSDDGVISEPPPPMSTEEVLDHLRKDKNGAKFVQALVSGDLSGFDTDDRSSIDFSIISKLCFYTIDPGIIREIMISSPIRRSKWDTMRGNVTYLDYIVSQGLQRCKQHYHPSKRKQDALPKKQFSIKSCDEEFCFSYEDIESNKCNAIYLSELFAKSIQGVVCYSITEKSFLIYSGVKWNSENSETQMARLARKFIKHCCNVIETKIKVLEQNKSKEPTDGDSDLDKAKRLLSYYQSQVSYSSRMKLIADVKDILAVDYTKFDAHPDYINVLNGTLNLATMQLQPHSSTDLLTQVCDVEYDPPANNERFSRFIDEICCGNQETKRYLQKVSGYLLHGANEEHALWIAFGPARNGKSTLMGVLRRLMNDYAVTADVDILTKPSGKGGGSAKPEILLLNKKRFIFMSEADKYSCLQASLIKQITGADNLSARGVYSNNIREFRVYGKIILACNNLPRINDMSLLASDRINILPFDKFFKKSERDTTLETQFLSPECRSAILNWMLKGYRLYREEGLKPTARMKEILEEYEKGYDVYNQFIEENLRLRKDNNRCDPTDTTLKAVWEAGKKWLKDNNYYVPTRRDFVFELKKAGVQIYKKNNQDYIKGFILGGEESCWNTEYENAADIRRKSSSNWHEPPRM